MLTNLHFVIPSVRLWVSAVHIWSLPKELIVLIQFVQVKDEAFVWTSLISRHLKHHVIICHCSFSADTGFFSDIIDFHEDVVSSFSCFSKAKVIFFPAVNSFLPSSSKVLHQVEPNFVLKLHGTSGIHIQMVCVDHFQISWLNHCSSVRCVSSCLLVQSQCATECCVGMLETLILHNVELSVVRRKAKVTIYT